MFGEIGGSTRTGPLIRDASSGVNPISLGVIGAGGVLDCQIGIPGTPTDCRLPWVSSVHVKHPASAQQQIDTVTNTARFNTTAPR